MSEKTKMRTFNMNISTELSNDLEREYRVINNNTRNAAWLMSEDVHFNNKKIQNYLSLVAEGLQNYDRLKDKINELRQDDDWDLKENFKFQTFE